MSRRRDIFGEEYTPHRPTTMAAFLVENWALARMARGDVLGHIDGSFLRRNYSGFDGLPARLTRSKPSRSRSSAFPARAQHSGKRTGGGTSCC